MRNNRRNLIIGITSVAALGLAIYITQRVKKERVFKRLNRIAEEGYETAGDILFPPKKASVKEKKLSEENDYSSNNVIFI